MKIEFIMCLFLAIGSSAVAAEAAATGGNPWLFVAICALAAWRVLEIHNAKEG